MDQTEIRNLMLVTSTCISTAESNDLHWNLELLNAWQASWNHTQSSTWDQVYDLFMSRNAGVFYFETYHYFVVQNERLIKNNFQSLGWRFGIIKVQKMFKCETSWAHRPSTVVGIWTILHQVIYHTFIARWQRSNCRQDNNKKNMMESDVKCLHFEELVHTSWKWKKILLCGLFSNPKQQKLIKYAQNLSCIFDRKLTCFTRHIFWNYLRCSTKTQWHEHKNQQLPAGSHCLFSQKYKIKNEDQNFAKGRLHLDELFYRSEILKQFHLRSSYCLKFSCLGFGCESDNVEEMGMFRVRLVNIFSCVNTMYPVPHDSFVENREIVISNVI